MRPGVDRTSSPDYAKAQLGKDPKDLRVAIIHEDGAYGVDVAKGNEDGAKKAGFNIVLKEGYSATAPDLSALVTKLKRARPDVIFHTGYNPDITLFLRQARELGLKFSALVGHGAGYGVYDKLKEGLGTDANYFFNVDPISIWHTNPKALDAEAAADDQDGRRGVSTRRSPARSIKSAHVGMAASNTYLFLTDVLPRAIKKYGGVDADALRKAALDTDLPDGGTMLGFGVKFEGEGSAMAGQNDRAFPVIIQYIDDKAVRGVAEEPAAARAGAAAAGRLDLQLQVGGWPRSTIRRCWKSRAWSSVSAASPPSTTCRSRSIRARFSA